MNHSDTILDRVQADVVALLGAAPALSTVNILAEDEGDIQAKVLRALQTLSDPKGKIGLACIVFPPEVVSAEKNLPGPVMALQIEVQIIEQVLLNRDLAKGSQISAAQGALRIIRALHRAHLGDVILYAEKDPAKKVAVKTGFVSYSVTLNIFEIGLEPAVKPAGVTAVVAAGKYTLTCATAGATIYYSTDGSFPCAGGAGSAAYAAPLTLAAGTQVRTAAAKAGMNPGDVTEFRATP